MPRKELQQWQKINKKPNIVIFEGWCVGVTPQKKKDLLVSTNVLEKEKDKNRVWRNKVNQELKNQYKKIFCDDVLCLLFGWTNLFSNG